MFENSPLEGTDLILADLDGVVYRGQNPVEHAIDSLNLAQKTVPVAYLTNNASRTPQSVSEQLNSLGLRSEPSDILTSPQAAVRLLKDIVPAPATILVVGGEGLRVELENAGYQLTESADDHPAAVLQGFSANVGWEQLAEASFALHDPEIPWIATNNDWTLPTARGLAPGNGTLVSAVHLATGRMPLVAGKPETALFDLGKEKFDARNPLMIGDRLDTDIQGANRAGIRSLLVLTGVDKAKQVLAADPSSRPTFIVRDLRELFQPYPTAEIESVGDQTRRIRFGESVVEMHQNRLVVKESGSRIDLLRAASAAIWTSGLAIYGLEVPAEIYS